MNSKLAFAYANPQLDVEPGIARDPFVICERMCHRGDHRIAEICFESTGSFQTHADCH